MRIQTLSIVVGGSRCNAHCPYCVSKMTPKITDDQVDVINTRNLHKACQFARDSGVSTVLLTGKGEPTLYQDDITSYLEEIKEYKFPFIELQTNGIAIRNNEIDDDRLRLWHDLGLNTVCVSVVHYDDDKNLEILQPGGHWYTGMPESVRRLPTLIRRLHNMGFSVRLSVVMIKDYIDTTDNVSLVIRFCKDNQVEQLTLRPVRCPLGCDNAVSQWVGENHVEDLTKIEDWVRDRGTLLMNLFHCAKVYDIDGQNVCMTDSLTHSPDPDEIRQLIFYSNGRIMYDWTHKGAVLL